MDNDANSIEAASITYAWNDGQTMTAKMNVIARHIRHNWSLFKSIHYTEDGQLTWELSSFYKLASDSEWSAPTSPSLTCTLLKRDATLVAGAYVGAVIVAAGAEFPGPWQVRLLCIAAGIGLAYVSANDVDAPFTPALTDFEQSIANTPEKGLWVDILPTGTITAETMHEYQFQVYRLPLYQTDWYVADKFGPTGFDGQEEESVKWQCSHRDGYKFKRLTQGGM